MKLDGSTAILMASFGTTHPDALERCIAGTERSVAARFPGYPVYRAFTSSIVIRRLKQRHGIAVDTVGEALERMKADGVRRVAVQPTLLLGGIEYERLLRVVQGCTGLCAATGKPLVAGQEDCEALASAIMAEHPLVQDEALLLMGHGTEHAANHVYHALQEAFDKNGYRGFIGTVEGEPSFMDAVARLTASASTRARLLPLMFVAGEHAKSDMAGEQEGSFLTCARAAGIAAHPALHGLGESEAIRALYVRRVEAALREVER